MSRANDSMDNQFANMEEIVGIRTALFLDMWSYD